MAFTAGRHRVRVTATALAETKNGTGQIVVGFEDNEGNSISAYLFTSDKAWEYTAEKLKVLGWDPVANGYRFEDLNLDPSPIAGNEVDIVTEEEQFEGKWRMKVKWINAPGLGVERMQPAQASSFAETLRARLLRGATATAGTPRGNYSRRGNGSPRYPDSVPPTDEDVPFDVDF